MPVEPRVGRVGVARGGARAGGRGCGVSVKRGASRDGEVSRMQRGRLVGAAVTVVDELGWTGVTVADVASRARVSRRTFYDLFSNSEDCLLTMLEDTVARVEQELSQANPKGATSWV